MSSKYDFLKEYMWPRYKDAAVEVVKNNVFHEVSSDEIDSAEKRMGCSFPSALKEFYREVGCGHLTTPAIPHENYKFYGANEVLPPLVVANFYSFIIDYHKKPENARTSLDVLLDLDQVYMSYEQTTISVDALELMQPGDLPFFEIGDSSLYMVTKPQSDSPNAVWFMGHKKIEDSFEKFIWRLYYEDPNYYAKDL